MAKILLYFIDNRWKYSKVWAGCLEGPHFLFHTIWLFSIIIGEFKIKKRWGTNFKVVYGIGLDSLEHRSMGPGDESNKVLLWEHNLRLILAINQLYIEIMLVLELLHLKSLVNIMKLLLSMHIWKPGNIKVNVAASFWVIQWFWF